MILNLDGEANKALNIPSMMFTKESQLQLVSSMQRKIEILAIIPFILGAIFLAAGAALAATGFLEVGISLCLVGGVILALGLLLFVKKDAVIKAAYLKIFDVFVNTFPSNLMSSPDNEITGSSDDEVIQVTPFKKTEIPKATTKGKTDAQTIETAKEIISTSQAVWEERKHYLKSSNLKKDKKQVLRQLYINFQQFASRFKKLTQRNHLSPSEQEELILMSRQICSAQPLSYQE